jgi:hypothetical protein
MHADEITSPFSSCGGDRKIMNHFVVNVFESTLRGRKGRGGEVDAEAAAPDGYGTIFI